MTLGVTTLDLSPDSGSGDPDLFWLTVTSSFPRTHNRSKKYILYRIKILNLALSYVKNSPNQSLKNAYRCVSYT